MMVRPLGIAIIVLGSSGAVRARAEEPKGAATPLVGVELRVGGGLSAGGGSGASALRYSPIDVGALVEVALMDMPRVAAWGAIYYEGLGRSAFGLAGGARLYPMKRGPVRLSLGVTGTVAPYTIGGALVAGGACLTVGGRFRFCADLEGTVFVLGNDLPADRVVGQLQLVLAVGWNAL